MGASLVLGAGLVGGELVRQLVGRGDTVTVATRSGTAVLGARAVSLDAADAAAIAAAADAASTIFLCTNPPYPQWATAWPPIFTAVAEAARRSGAAVVAMGNLYPYGEATMPMTEHSHEITTESKGLVRKAGWALLREATERGEIRAVEVRASDYFGPGATETAHLGERFFSPILASRTAGVVGDPDAAHSWAYLPDIAATLVAASDHEEWGRIWHVPAATNASRRELAQWVNDAYGTAGRVSAYPQFGLRMLGLVNPLMREVYKSSYQFTKPFVSDATETQRLRGVAATDADEALRMTADSYRQ